MYTVDELYELEKNPKINEISLKLLLDYYDTYLFPYTYRVFTNDEEYITVCFPTDGFCHLLGLETIAKRSVSKGDIHNYKGNDGFNNVKSLLITFDTLKKLNKKMFNSVKDKFVFFYLIPKILDSKSAVFYDDSSSGSNVLSDIMFYDDFINAYVHMGVVKNDGGVYVPRTFFVERITVSNDGLRFIKDQKKFDIKKIEVDKIEGDA